VRRSLAFLVQVGVGDVGLGELVMVLGRRRKRLSEGSGSEASGCSGV
jgi:hypothetical protein